MAEPKVIGLFSVGRGGGYCLHEGKATKVEAERIRKLLNKSVTGGPYTILLAMAASIDGVPVDAREQREHLWNEARKLIDKAISTAYRDPAGTTGDDCAVETSNARIAALDFVHDAIRAGVKE